MNRGLYSICVDSSIGDNVIAWHYCNIYGATIGKNCKIGSYTEIGPAIIGDNVEIGAQCFIPQGVTIQDGAWIGPCVKICNDKYPPSGKENWQPVLIKKNARIGMGVIILPGITIGQGALIGAGSVVTKDIPDGARAYGVPAEVVNA